MYCKCMRLQKIQGSDMKLGVSQHFDKSDHLPMMTPSSNTGGICEAPKNSTVPNPKDTKKKHPKGCFLRQNNTKYRYRRETKKSQCNHKLAIEVVTTGGYNVTTDGYRVKT